MEKSTINKKHIVTKGKQLNELEPCGMSLQGLRFFSIYLSKINPLDVLTRKVHFRLSDFKKIMELKKIKRKDLIRAINDILTQTVGIPLSDDDEDFSRFQIFKECTITKDSIGERIVIIDAHDKALPLMFNLKGPYFKYELWNALRPKSRNQLRMYEILKQYEWCGARVITIKRLKEYLGIKEDQYKRYGDFKRRVLNSCQKTLAENTDISFTYEPYGPKDRGGKVISLKFTITKNENFKDDLQLEKFIDMNSPEIKAAINSVPNPDDDTADETDSAAHMELRHKPAYAVTDSKPPDVPATPAASVPPAEPATTYGRYENVKLTDAEYRELVNKYSYDVIEDYIDQMDSYIEETDKHYNKQSVVLGRWIEKARRENKSNSNRLAGRVTRRNRFDNYKARERDYAHIEKLERAYMLKCAEEG